MSKSSKVRIVLFQGAFDILNWGHVKALRAAKAQGDYLIVALNSNELIEKYKGYPAVLPWYQKKFIMESCRYVDKVVKATRFSPLNLLKRYNVDVYCVAREWKETKKEEIAYMKAKGRRVVYFPRFSKVVSSGDIKKRLLEEANGGKS